MSDLLKTKTVDGVVVPLTAAEEADLINRQNAEAAALPAKVKSVKRLAIENERDARGAGGVKVTINGVEHWFSSTEKQRMQYAILDRKADRAGWPGTTVIRQKWPTLAKAKVPMTVDILRQILDAGIALEMTLYDVAEAHIEAMEQSADPANYDYSANWPERYIPSES